MAGSGTGPGAITSDGCAVEVYLRLPLFDEVDIVRRVVAPPASVLDLGCGVGRISNPLAAQGFSVVGVDESTAMLAHVVGAQTVHGTIQGLDLHQRFDAVLLMSHLVDVPDDAGCLELLAVCARHLEATGTVVMQRHPEAWWDGVADRAPESLPGNPSLKVGLRDVTRPRPEVVSATVVYEADSKQWTQSFTARRRSLAELGELLRAAGLGIDAVLDDGAAWLAAVPIPSASRR